MLILLTFKKITLKFCNILVGCLIYQMCVCLLYTHTDMPIRFMAFLEFLCAPNCLCLWMYVCAYVKDIFFGILYLNNLYLFVNCKLAWCHFWLSVTFMQILWWYAKLIMLLIQSFKHLSFWLPIKNYFSSSILVSKNSP